MVQEYLRFLIGRCKRAIDMAFAVDTSGSIGMPNFNQIKEFLYIVVRDHDVGEDFAHFAVIHFSDNATVLFNFNRLRNAQLTATNVNNLINMIPYEGGETSIDLALIRARDHVFTDAGGWRSAQNIPKVSKILIPNLSRSIILHAVQDNAMIKKLRFMFQKLLGKSRRHTFQQNHYFQMRKYRLF